LFLLCSNYRVTNRPASWRMPTPKQMEKLAAEASRGPEASAAAPDAPPRRVLGFGAQRPSGPGDGAQMRLEKAIGSASGGFGAIHRQISICTTSVLSSAAASAVPASNEPNKKRVKRVIIANLREAKVTFDRSTLSFPPSPDFIAESPRSWSRCYFWCHSINRGRIRTSFSVGFA
jgi:hypothetical protein